MEPEIDQRAGGTGKPVVPALQRPREGERKVKANLGYIENSRLT